MIDLLKLLVKFERIAIETALYVSNGCVAVAARSLGLKRTTLIEKCRRMKIDPNEYEEVYEVQKPAPINCMKVTDQKEKTDRKPIESNIRYEMLMSAMRTLERHNYNRTSAAKELGICIRTMRMWVDHARSMGMDVPSNPHNVGKPIRKKRKQNEIPTDQD